MKNKADTSISAVPNKPRGGSVGGPSSSGWAVIFLSKQRMGSAQLHLLRRLARSDGTR